MTPESFQDLFPFSDADTETFRRLLLEGQCWMCAVNPREHQFTTFCSAACAKGWHRLGEKVRKSAPESSDTN